MLSGMSTMFWLKRRHLRAELNFWLWAAGADLDDTRDLSDRIYLLYLVVLVGGCLVACWLWILGLVTGAATAADSEMAAITADAAMLIAGAALALPACAAALWSVRAAWRSPWAASAPDASWLAQTPVALPCWNVIELAPRMAARAILAGAAGYLVAAFAACALAGTATLAMCLPFAVTCGCATAAACAVSWLVGIVRLRLTAARRLPLTGIVAALAITLVVCSGMAIPTLSHVARDLILAPAAILAAPVCTAAAALLATAATLPAAASLSASSLTYEATDAQAYAVRHMALYNPKMYRALIKRRAAARRKPLGHMPRIEGTGTALARSAISLLRRYDTLPQLLAAGAVLAPAGVGLLTGSLAQTSAALGLLGGAAGGRVLGAACWLLFAINCSELPRSLARTFLDDTSNRFMRDHLPISTPKLLSLDALPSLAVAAIASALVCIPVAWAAGVSAALDTFASALALDATLLLCGALDAAERTPGKLRLSCEGALGVTAVASALLAAVLPAALAPLAFWAAAAIVALASLRTL